MPDTAKPPKGAANKRRKAIGEKARALATEQGRDWANLPKEERKQLRKTAKGPSKAAAT